jgi:hypothetical protein
MVAPSSSIYFYLFLNLIFLTSFPAFNALGLSLIVSDLARAITEMVLGPTGDDYGSGVVFLPPVSRFGSTYGSGVVFLPPISRFGSTYGSGIVFLPPISRFGPTIVDFYAKKYLCARG